MERPTRIARAFTMRVEPLRHDDAIDRPVGLQQDLALGQIKIERIAFVARELDQSIGRVERLQDRLQ